MEKAEKIGDILRRVLATAGLQQESSDRKNSFVDWEKIWAETFRETIPFCYVLDCEKNILKVKVNSSAWLMELKRRKPQIKKDLEARAGIPLRDIYFLR